MLNKFIFLNHQSVILNDPGRETISAGLGPIGQYGITLLALIIIGVIVYIKRKKRKASK